MMEVLKPSILLGVGIHRSGGVHYARKILEEYESGEGEVKEWNTVKTIDDKKDLEDAERAASKLRRMVGKLCARTSFGYLCPLEKEGDLDDLLAEMRHEAREVTLGLKTCALTVSFIKGRIAANDADAAKALTAEIGSFLTQLTDAIASADVKLIRHVLVEARGLDTLLAPAQSSLLQEAVAEAREAAKTIRKEMEKKGRSKELVVQGLALSAIDSARMCFLELAEVSEPSRLPSVDASRFAVAASS